MPEVAVAQSTSRSSGSDTAVSQDTPVNEKPESLIGDKEEPHSTPHIQYPPRTHFYIPHNPIFSLRRIKHLFRGFRAAVSVVDIKVKRQQSIFAVLTDSEMPGSMDGLRLAHYVRDRHPPTVLLVASGVVRPKPEDLPTDAKFFAKPFNPRVLLQQLCQA